MAVTKEEVQRIAALARLAVSEDEAERFTNQLNSILAHVEELRAAEASRAAETGPASAAALLEPAPAPRDDEPGAVRLAAPPSSFAPDWRDGFFVVPRLAALNADADAEDAQEGA